MRVVRLLLIYLIVVFIGGALLAPWVWKGAQSLGAAFPAFAPVAAHPFHRYVNRCLIVLALVGALPLIRSFHLGSLHEMGWVQPWKRPVALGFALGFSSLGLVIAVQLHDHAGIGADLAMLEQVAHARQQGLFAGVGRVAQRCIGDQRGMPQPVLVERAQHMRIGTLEVGAAAQVEHVQEVIATLGLGGASVACGGRIGTGCHARHGHGAGSSQVRVREGFPLTDSFVPEQDQPACP